MPKVLQQIEELFYGTLGTWETDPAYFKLKQNAKSICLKPYPVQKLYEEISKKEVES